MNEILLPKTPDMVLRWAESFPADEIAGQRFEGITNPLVRYLKWTYGCAYAFVSQRNLYLGNINRNTEPMALPDWAAAVMRELVSGGKPGAINVTFGELVAILRRQS